MKLIVHIGLHKTASTFLQHLMNDNHLAMRQRGVWYAPQEFYPAHHHAAWRLLVGDTAPLAQMIAEARAADCHTVILSSEDLEGAIYDPRPHTAIAKAAFDGGMDIVQWHVVLRDPGAYFSSLHAQLAHHIYADSLALFHDVMRRGYVHIADPAPGDGTPYWYFCFDQMRDLSRFADTLATAGPHQLIAHDYADGKPFPGWRMLAEAGVLDAIKCLPGDDARNIRMPLDAVAQGYVQQILALIPDEDDQTAILESFTDSLRANLAGTATYAPIVGRRYAASHQAALARFAKTPD
jgi:hypothetical protein